MDLSKLALLLRPLTFHTANHEAIVFWCSVGAAGYLLFDFILYLTLGNIYYCHPLTLKRALEVYNINMSNAKNMSLSEIHVSVFHHSIDIFLAIIFVVITMVNGVFQCKRNRVADIAPLRPVLQEFPNQSNQENIVSNQGQSENFENQMQVPGQISEVNIQNTRSTITIDEEPTFRLSEGQSGNSQCDSNQYQFLFRVILMPCKSLLSEISYSIVFFFFIYITTIIIKLASFSRNG